MKTPGEKHAICLEIESQPGPYKLSGTSYHHHIGKGTLSKWYNRWCNHGKSPEAFMVKRGRPVKKAKGEA